MLFSRAWFALMRRNAIYRKRHIVSSIFEFAFPFCFVWIMVAIKNSVKRDEALVYEAILPDEALVPFSYSDYMLAMQSQKVCQTRSDPNLEITGLHQNGKNWQVPFVRCDSRMCQYVGQDAQPFCQYSILAVSGSAENDAGGRERAEGFRDYVYDRWPFLLNIRNGRENPGRPFPFEFVQIFRDPDAMDDYVGRSDYGTEDVPRIGMGIVFDGNDPTNYKYWLRQNSTNMNIPEREDARNPSVVTTPPTDRLFNDFARTDFETCRKELGSQEFGDFQDSCTGLYVYNGVLATQRLVGDFILDQTGASDAGFFVANGGVSFVQFPQEEYIANGFFERFGDISPLLFTLGLLYPAAAMIGYIVREKGLRQKELMKIMSVTESDIGWAWFTSFFLFHLLSATVAAIISTILFDESSFWILWGFWQLTLLAIIVFCMTMSALTSKNNRAMLIGVLLLLMGAFLTIVVDFNTLSPALVRFLSLHPITAFTYGILGIGRLEDLSLGLTSNTIDFTESNMRFSLETTMRWLGVDVLLWGFLAYYLNRVVPQDYGQNLPLWFPFMPSHWCPSIRHPTHEHASAIEEEADGSGAVVEPVGANLKRQSELGQSIEIHNLRKTYGEKIAVDNLNLSMYSGQITALLGHNGAGKTTTINILTGAVAPTSGHASITGMDIRTEMSGIRQDIGICFQHDCLFPELTVREHVQFFARLKGLYANESFEEAEKQVDQAIVDVALSEKRHTVSRHLSGGMKRKLSVAIAFCGGSKVVLLDEPTSGMDPFSRRFTWDVIRRYRQDRCIILTTHFMDEADILGDRIAIMAEGQLRCVGSSLWLKKQYSVGYQLTIERLGGLRKIAEDEESLEAGDMSTDSDSDMEVFSVTNTTLKRIVTDAVPKASVITDVGAELSYRLPIGDSSKFAGLFEELDKRVDKEEISSYGVSITTLNAVFLAVTRGATPETTKELRSSRKLSLSTLLESPRSSVGRFDSPSKLTNDDADDAANTRVFIDSQNDVVFFRHLGSLLKKRSLYFRRDKKAWICTTLVPTFFVLIGLIVFVAVASNRNMDPMTLNMEDYNPDLGSSITFNSPDNPFLCQPGLCSHREPYVDNGLSDELYVWCGLEARLGIGEAGNGRYIYEPTNQTCTISESAAIIDTIFDRATPDQAGVQNISEASLYLNFYSRDYAHSKYGAVWFTHDQTSVTKGRLYNESVIEQCSFVSSQLTYSQDCVRYGGVGYVIQYNYTALHAALMFEALANEALVRHATDNLEFTVEATIAPLPITDVEKKIGAGEDAFAVWFLIVFGFPFIAAAYASFVVTERKIGAKHLQTVAGVEPSAYWLSTLMWDVLNYQIPLWVTIVLFVLFDVDILTTSERDVLSGVITLLFLFGPAAAGFAYCVSFCFKSASTANIFLIIGGFVIGMGGPLTCFILVLLARDPRYSDSNLDDISNILTWILRFMPAFCLGNGLYSIINMDVFLFLAGETSSTSVWSGSILLYDVYFLAAQSLFYPFLAMQFDVWSTNPHCMSMLGKCFYCLTCKNTSSEKQAAPIPDDGDVLAEEEAVMSADADRKDLILIQNLTKLYDNGKLAVDRLSLGIAPGECFGLLGINGAGKTTTMKMLTAEFPPSSGDAILDGFSVSKEPQETRRKIGYCPQFDAHFANLTGREHVELYANIKGIPSRLIAQAVDEKLREVGLSTSDSNKLSSGFSGGMKRRLSLACATIGQPQIVFLDECSTGVDPVAREEIWKMISEMVAGRGLPQAEKPSVILTTHSMEECEALCPRIGIMANGRLRCLGSAQRLKSKFGQGFQVELKAHFVDHDDDDFEETAELLKRYKPRSSESTDFFSLQDCVAALDCLSGNDLLSKMVSAENGPGYNVWKDATSPVGVSIDELAEFATTELRMTSLEKFVSDTFPTYVLRERQDTKARYEVKGSGLRISKIFASIEENKEELRLADYSVSQTSLEQVFNMHAAEAERHKQGRLERLT